MASRITVMPLSVSDDAEGRRQTSIAHRVREARSESSSQLLRSRWPFRVKPCVSIRRANPRRSTRTWSAAMWQRDIGAIQRLEERAIVAHLRAGTADPVCFALTRAPEQLIDEVLDQVQLLRRNPEVLDGIVTLHRAPGHDGMQAICRGRASEDEPRAARTSRASPRAACRAKSACNVMSDRVIRSLQVTMTSYSSRRRCTSNAKRAQLGSIVASVRRDRIEQRLVVPLHEKIVEDVAAGCALARVVALRRCEATAVTAKAMRRVIARAELLPDVVGMLKWLAGRVPCLRRAFPSFQDSATVRGPHESTPRSAPRPSDQAGDAQHDCRAPRSESGGSRHGFGRAALA